MTTQAFFNLATEPWIPVRLLDGTVDVVGWQDLFLRSGEIEDLVPDPILAAPVILRLATAMLLRSHDAPLSSPAIDDWRDWAETALSSGVDSEKIKKYFIDNAEKFWLIHPDFPFLQDSAIAKECDKSSSVNKLRLDVSSGNNALWWGEKILDNEARCLSHAEAAIHMCVQWGYASGGRCLSRKGVANSTQSPLRPRTLFMLRCDCLWGTLLLQCVPTADDHTLAVKDRCEWENGDTQTRAPGLLSRLTASPKGLLLVGDEVSVNDFYITWGNEVAGNFWDRDTMSALRRKKDDSVYPYKASMERGVWSDAESILASVGLEGRKELEPPLCLSPSHHPLGRTLSFLDARVITITHGADKSKEVEWVTSTTPGVLKATEASDPVLYSSIRQYILLTGEVVSAVNRATSSIQLKDQVVKVSVAAPDFKRRLWAELQDGFLRVLNGADWEDIAKTTQKRFVSMFDVQTSALEKPETMMAVVQARKKLLGAFYEINEKYNLAADRKEDSADQGGTNE